MVGTTVTVAEKRMERVEVEAANKIIGQKFPVLDHGFVVLVDYMGSDSSIVQAARTSYGQGTKSVRDDAGLIRYLMRHRHTTPFEMVELKFFIGAPMSEWRQHIRHRTASVNEYSSRYSEVKDVVYIPALEDIATQSKSNRQGRGERLPIEEAEAIRNEMDQHAKVAYALYRKLLEAGVARETARGVLPLDTYTEAYWKIDLWNLFHFLGLRLDSHAQLEIRAYANRMHEIARVVAPVACEAFDDFVINSIALTKKERVAVRAMLRSDVAAEDACSSAGLQLVKEDGTPFKTGEGPEFIEKLARIRASVI